MINYKSAQKKNLKIPLGYTLIELLVTLTIVGLLFGFGFVSFRDFSRRQALQGVIQNVKGDLRLAQSDALSGQIPIGCTANLDGYSFYVVSQSEYQILANCGVSQILVKDVSLPSGITIDNSATPTVNPIMFKTLGQGTNIPASNVSTIITLKQQNTTNSATVTVTIGGQIQ